MRVAGVPPKLAVAEAAGRLSSGSRGRAPSMTRARHVKHRVDRSSETASAVPPARGWGPVGLRLSLAPVLQQAPGLLDEVVEAGIVAVHDLTSARHGGLDILNRKETCVLPVGSLRAVFGHTTRLPDSRLPRAWRGSTGRRCRVLHVTGDGSREKAAGVPGRLTAGWRAAIALSSVQRLLTRFGSSPCCARVAAVGVVGRASSRRARIRSTRLSTRTWASCETWPAVRACSVNFGVRATTAPLVPQLTASQRTMAADTDDALPPYSLPAVRSTGGR